jgi:hypothetical protein
MAKSSGIGTNDGSIRRGPLGQLCSPGQIRMGIDDNLSSLVIPPELDRAVLVFRLKLA